MRNLDSVTHLKRSLDIKFGELKPEARDLAMVTELHRRGLLDQLVAALRDLIITLLGSGGGVIRRQSGTDQIEQAIHQITCILDSLFGSSEDSCSDVLGGSGNNSTNTTGSATTSKSSSSLEKGLKKLGAQFRNGSSITQVVDNLMSNSNNSTDAKATKKSSSSSSKEKRSIHHLEERQDSGVEGLLVSLRDVIDTILNTLLPMSSRDESSAAATSITSSKDCPSASTPNDGQYRPGCPGYGRRDLAVRRSMQALGERDANVLQTILPMIEMLLKQLPQLLQSGSSSSSTTATASSTGSSAKAASPISSTENSLSQLMSALGYGDSSSSASSTKTASTGKATATSTTSPTTSAVAEDSSSAARSAANLSRNQARDLLNADGMNLGKRQTTTDANDTGSDVGSDNCDASGNSGGINDSLLSNLLNGLLGGLSRRSDGSDIIDAELVRRLFSGDEGADLGKRQTTDDTSDDVGSGNCSASNNTGGINVSHLDNLLNGLLGGLSRRDVEEAGMNPVEALTRDVKGSFEAHAPALQARADFLPVWKAIKNIGDEHFHAASGKRDVANSDSPNFTPVWEAFRDLVDSGYSQASKQQQRRDDSSLKLDYKPLIKAGSKFAGQIFKSFGKQHAKRSADFKPLIEAASQFASKAIKEVVSAHKSN